MATFTRDEIKALTEGRASEALERKSRDHVRASKRPVSYSSLHDILVETVLPILKRMNARIVELEQREYQGIWDPQRRYLKGAHVTRAGSLWVALVNHTRSEPGTDPVSWRLAVKNGALRNER